MSTNLSLNCAVALAAPPSLEPNPDISGIGVLIGFFVTAYLSLILLIVHYILVFDPAEASLIKETHRANDIDVIVLRFVTIWITRPQKTWEKAMEKMIVMMSDQQMVTGIALLSSASTQLKFNISAYHWQITIYLVWFSSFTHLATLTFLRGYLREHSPLRWWRLFFMTVLVGLLVAALIPTGNGDWLPVDKPDMAGIPAICLFNYPSNDTDSAPLTTMLFSVLVLCMSYTTRAIKLFAWSSKFSRLVLRTKPGTLIKRHLQKLYEGGQISKTNKWMFFIPYCIILSIFLVLRSWSDLLESMFWELTWLLIALLWGTLRLFATRNTTVDQNRNILEENSWGFGQCLATAMLVLLLFFGVETYIETRRLTRKDPSILTNSEGNPSSIDIDGTGETPLSRPLSTDNGNNNSVAPDTSTEPTASEEVDIDNQVIVATGTEEQLRRTTRPTSLSWEERSLETLPRRAPSTWRSSSEISRTTPPAPAPAAELRRLPPHERNYYDDGWYTSLAILNFCLIAYLSAGVLSGAYITDSRDSEVVELFGSVRDVGALFLNLINWIFLYAPLSSFTFTMFHVCFTEMLNVRWRLRNAGRMLCICIVGLFSGLTSGHIPLPWETLLPFGKKLIAFWVYGIFWGIYVPWYWIISYKLKRETEI